MYSNGFVMSKLLYALPAYTTVFDEKTHKEEESRNTAFTKHLNRRLQTAQCTALRTVKGLGRETTTAKVLKDSDSMSVQQLAATTILSTAHKVINTTKPKFLKDRFILNKYNKLKTRSFKLSITAEGFVQTAIRLFNTLPPNLRSEKKPTTFTKNLKTWIKSNIQLVPQDEGIG